MCTICALTIEFAVEHPLSLAVAVSTRHAIDTGVLPDGNTLEMDMARSRHQAVVLLTAMQQRLEQVLSPSRRMALPNFFVLMIESRTWGYFQPTSDGFDVRADPPPPRVQPDENGVRDCVVVIAQATAAAITMGGLPFDEALAAGIIVVDELDGADRPVRTAFATSYPVGQFSDFFCAEVA